MRFSRRIYALFTVLILVAVVCLHAGPPIYDPPDLPDLPPFPDDPWPLDPPDIWDIPFDPIDLPDPLEIDFPDEDPFDDPDFPPLPPLPDPFELDDPFFEPSLFDDDPLGYSMQPGLEIPGDGLSKNSRAAANVLTKLMPFPMRLPFHPAPSATTAARTRRVCNAATATRMIVTESKRNRVAFVDTCPYKVTTRVTVGSRPAGVTGTPDGQFALVANSSSASVSIINIASASVVGTIPLPTFNGAPAQPNNIAVLPDGSRAYVTNHDDRQGSVVYVIDLASRSVITQINVGNFPASIAVTPDGSQVWVPCRGDSNVFVIDTLTNTIVATILNLTFPTGVAINPTGTTVYVGSAPLSGNGSVAVIDPSTFTVRSTIPVGVLPHMLAVTPTGRHLFVTNLGSNSITQIDTASNRVIRNIAVPRGRVHPLGITFIR